MKFSHSPPECCALYYAYSVSTFLLYVTYVHTELLYDMYIILWELELQVDAGTTQKIQGGELK